MSATLPAGLVVMWALKTSTSASHKECMRSAAPHCGDDACRVQETRGKARRFKKSDTKIWLQRICCNNRIGQIHSV